MVFGFFTLIVALIISGIAAYYSIVGLTAIFSAAVVPIIIMGAALEVGKITAAVWLKLNWHRANWTYKVYLVPAVAVLMLLTSMGIFGFLSKAHSDQSLETGNADARIVIIDEKIKIERDGIEVNRKALKQLDEQVDQMMLRSKDERGAERAAQIRRNQQRERAKLLQDIEAAQTRITKLTEERAPMAAELRKIVSEVGPIKYIAALIYDENPDNNLLEKAVRLVIIVIVAVFDPLALVLILAAQQSIRWGSEERRQQRAQRLQVLNTIASTEDTKSEPVEVPLQDEKILDSAKDTHVTEQHTAPPADQFDLSKHSYLTKPWVHPGKLKPMVATDPVIADSASTVVEDVEKVENSKSTVAEAMELKRGHGQVPVEAAERPNQKKVAQSSLSADNEPKGKEVKAHFGISFPDRPDRGELFLRVDYLPSKLFRYNGSKWIEVDKNLTDSYIYNEDYIKYLINEIDQGKIDIDELTVGERNQITEFLKNNEQGRNSS